MAFDPKGADSKLREDSHTVMSHENKQGEYSKYFPRQELVDYDQYGERYSIQANAKGFRGKDYDVGKLPGVIRVVTLGGSSTFGYHDRDNETYPSYMEEMLNARLRDGACVGIRSFEVINLGMPHHTSPMILALFREEGIPLHPDFVTFYEGANDTAIDIDRLGTRNAWDSVPLYYKFVRKLRQWLISFALIDNLLTIYTEQFTDAEVQRHFEGKLERFLTNVEMMQEESKKAGAEFIVADQQTRSLMFKQSEIRGMTYAYELNAVKNALQIRGWVGRNELYFVTHGLLMDGLRDWAKRKRVVFVGVTNAMDSRRDFLLTWVHLVPDGNRLIAGVFADAIFSQACHARTGTPSTLVPE